MTSWLDMPAELNEEECAAKTAELLDLAARHLDPQIKQGAETNRDLAIIEWRAQGSYIYDIRGQAYYDAAGAGGVFGLGHAHPAVIAAMRKQLDKGGLSLRAGIVPGQLELTAKLAEITPGHLPYAYLGSTGTESIEAGLKLAMLTTGRHKVIGCEFGYHGSSIATVKAGGIPYWHDSIPDVVKDFELVPFNNIEAAQQAIDENTAAFILEPIQWAPGCRVATPDYLRALRQRCDETGTLLILDEIQTGLGRTGAWFCCDHSQVVPDMISVGKTLSGGMIPISALMYNERVHNAEIKRPLFNNSTFSGNPLACAAALAVLDVMEKENLVEHSKAMGALLKRELHRLLMKYPLIFMAQKGLGMMRCIFAREPVFGFVISSLMMIRHHVILPALMHAPFIMRISMALNSSEAEIMEFINKLDATCKEMNEMGPQGMKAYLDKLSGKA